MHMVKIQVKLFVIYTYPWSRVIHDYLKLVLHVFRKKHVLEIELFGSLSSLMNAKQLTPLRGVLLSTLPRRLFLSWVNID